jgi:hypothetical protein
MDKTMLYDPNKIFKLKPCRIFVVLEEIYHEIQIT